MPDANAPQSSPFYIGLNMAGAVSAGAYTAGVMDFLIDALDTWYLERENQLARHGNDFDKWEIPAHEARLSVMAGASAGGMTSAIATAALCEQFTPVRAVPPPGTPPANRLYQSWVADIDIRYLLGTNDLAQAGSIPQSLLDSTRLDTIAANALHIQKPLAKPRPYISDPLRLVLTLTNLKGIPYAIEQNAGSDETQTLYRSDQQSFHLSWGGGGSTDSMIALDPRNPAPWAILQEVAKATGAFPVALKSRILTRTTKQYKGRQWRLPTANPSPPDWECEALQPLLPSFATPADRDFQTLNVDGGVTNNNPFDCVYNELSQLPPKQPIGRLKWDAQHADRAVVSIAPFLSSPEFSLDDKLDGSLLGLIPQLLDTLVNQSRITGESIRLTRNTDVFSAFHISPSIDETTKRALASGSLGAFGGFLAQAFRDHDYQLGRRNCQWFLKQHFGLPLTNDVMKQSAPTTEESKQRILRDFGMDLTPDQKGVQIIPVLGDLKTEIKVNPVKIDAGVLSPLATQAVDRLKLVAVRVLEQKNANFLTKTAFQTGWLLLSGKLRGTLLDAMVSGLKKDELLK